MGIFDKAKNAAEAVGGAVKDAAKAVGGALDPQERIAGIVDHVVARLKQKYEPPELRIRIENNELVARLEIKEKQP
jgi:uncharacterized protein YjbJ (UPF0337 family)